MAGDSAERAVTTQDGPPTDHAAQEPAPGERVRVCLADGRAWTGTLLAMDDLTGGLRLICAGVTLVLDGRAVRALEPAPDAADAVAPFVAPPVIVADEPHLPPGSDAGASLATTVTIAPTAPDTRFLANLRVLALLFLATALIYGLSYGGEGRAYDYFVRLADAFVHGRLYLTEQPSWLAELAPHNGHFYVIYPPMPAVLLMPFVALFGPEFPQPAASILFGAANVALAYLVVLRLFQNRSVALWVAVLYAIGTNQWYHAEVGSVWYYAQMVAPFFIWLALLEGMGRARLWLIGLLVSAAFLSRLPAVGAAAFFVVYCWDRFVPRRAGPGDRYLSFTPGPYLELGLGLLAGVAVTLLYNQARFGSPRDFGYTLVPGLIEPRIYPYGWMSARYIPTHLDEMLTALPMFQREWPFAIPRYTVMALWVTTPAWLIIAWADWRSRLVQASAAAVGATLVAILLHGGPGLTQFGYRYGLDFMPFLLILTASGMRGRVTAWMQALIGLSILVNFWGVVMLTRLDWWVW